MTPQQILAEVCSIPTAPFAEQRVVAYAREFAAKRKLRVTEDRWGNLLLSLGPAPRAGQKRLVLAAHMDHPGFVADRQDGNLVHAHFRGGVFGPYVLSAKVRFFTPTGEVTATVESTAGETTERPVPTSAVLRVKGPVPPGSPGMFDFTPAKFTAKGGGHFHSRVCDDLAGAAAALSALDALARKKPKLPFAVLLTRAEEVGFIGAIGAATKPELLRKADDLLVAIECSAEQPYAQQHNGVIIRVGDRTSIFNSSLTAFLTATAEQLTKTDKTFRYQRALMPGGSCESTAYDAYGFHAAAVCVPLGNYHNMNKAKKVLAPENISTADYLHMVQLFLALAHSAHTYRPGHIALKDRLEKSFARQKHLLA